MKIATTIARYLLGLIFVVFALNFWLKFLPVPQPEEGSAAAMFMGAFYGSGALALVKVLELIGGALLLAGRFVNLGLVFLGPIVVNIAIYNVLIAKSGYGMTALLVILAVVTLAGRRDLITAITKAK